MDTIDSEAGAMTIAAHNKSRHRPQSRASTASIHSITTQPTLDQSYTDGSQAFSNQWLGNDHSQRKELSPNTHQMAPEDLILHAASQLQNGRSFSMDPGPPQTMGHAMSFQQHANLSRHPLPGEAYGGNTSFTEDSQMLDREDNEDGDSVAGLQPAQKSSNRTSANNELEMRQLFHANKHRGLQDVATELHGNERGPNSERTRQVFAMLWINTVCTKGKGSVPRGRVYANYASRCATERITVLNPASFGKLVRVLFPGLKTRRLGVRGESKYHYVNFTLIDDQPELREPAIQPTIPFPEPSSFSQSFKLVSFHTVVQEPSADDQSTVPSQPTSTTTRKAVLPSPEVQQQPKAQLPAGDSASRTHSVYNQPDISSIDQLQSTTMKTSLPLHFSLDIDESSQQSGSLVLPRIEPCLPLGTDPDAAKSLTALYRSHCTSLVECIRYCKEKTFFHLFTSFQGTLTMPVQKLFSSPGVAPWIEECDFILYQKMMRIISGLTLQVVPKQVLDTLRNISERLVPHIRESFQGQPLHVIRAKEAPATIFAALLDRALRVNLTAHAAANMLSNSANRDQMYLDWITMVRIRKVAECVPTRGMDDLVNLLLTELRDLLDPTNVPWEIECLTLYGDVAMRNGRPPQGDTSRDVNAQNVLERWVNFLRSLPSRFPYASHSEIVWCVQRLGTAVMRDLTISQGKSFGSWWVTKCWIDEMISFLAEQGGFLQQKNSSLPETLGSSKRSMSDPIPTQQSSRFSNGSDGASNMTQSQPDRAPFSQVDTANHDSFSMTAASHDDSGIGIRTPEEEFPVDKHQFYSHNLPAALGSELQPQTSGL